MNNFRVTAISAAFCLAASAGAIGATLSKADYDAAGVDIAAKYKSDQAACSAMAGNTKDICSEEAKGNEKVAKAELEANFVPSEKHRYDVRIAKADAAFAVSKEKCDDATGNAKDVCRAEAKAAHVSALADAKVAVKTSEANTTAREKTTEARDDATAAKRDAGYAVAKEKCDALVENAKAGCIKEAKLRYGQS